MKIFANKSIWKKIVIVLLFITLFAFITPQPTQASVGGALMEPICNFLVGLGDGVINVIHQVILGENHTLTEMDFINPVKIAKLLVALVVIVSVVALGFTFPAIGGVLVKVVGAVFKTIFSGTVIKTFIIVSIGLSAIGVSLPRGSFCWLEKIHKKHVFRHFICTKV